MRSDPHLLLQVIRNLISNALKYTRRGKVLLGCRRRGDMLRIEIWGTGIGIPNDKLEAFDVYHQLDNAVCERSRGLSLGSSIANRLADLFGDRISVRSQPGGGSVFSIKIMLAPLDTSRLLRPADQLGANALEAKLPAHKSSIFVIEDDSEVRDLPAAMLRSRATVR